MARLAGQSRAHPSLPLVERGRGFPPPGGNSARTAVTIHSSSSLLKRCIISRKVRLGGSVLLEMPLEYAPREPLDSPHAASHRGKGHVQVSTQNLTCMPQRIILLLARRKGNVAITIQRSTSVSELKTHKPCCFQFVVRLQLFGNTFKCEDINSGQVEDNGLSLRSPA